MKTRIKFIPVVAIILALMLMITACRETDVTETAGKGEPTETELIEADKEEKPVEDDGLILNNVYAAGINLGGLTKEEAKNALHLVTDSTFKKKDMVVKFPDTVLALTPADTGAKLDVDAVAEAAYSYGRTGTREKQHQARKNAANSIYTVDLLPYLDLNWPYIQNAIKEKCSSYSSVMTQPKVTLLGNRPTYNPDSPDLSVVHQTLEITIGTPAYCFDPDKLYEQVLDAYSHSIWEVTCSVATMMPETLNAEELFREFCITPVDAYLNLENFDVVPEVYGYGFDIAAVQKLIDKADYGQTITVQLDFITPSLTAEELRENMFLDVDATPETATFMFAF